MVVHSVTAQVSAGFILGYVVYRLVGASLNEPHSNVENGMVVHARRTAAKNGIATHYCSLVQWFMYKQTNTINLRILPYKYFVLQKYLSSCPDVPY